MIFNKSSNGSAELKALIGFIYKSINFENLRSYIGFGERDIKKVIGTAVFKVAEDHYLSAHFKLDNPDKDHPEYLILDELVEKVQLPVAIHAYRRYVPSSDLTHSDKGRQIFVGSEEKPAFEWQIEKDNENLVNLAHEATDVLIEFLDEHIDDVTGTGENVKYVIPWGSSAAYEKMKGLFIPDVGEFEKAYLIGGSRYTFLSLVPFILRVQENEIKATLTADRYDEIREQILDGDLSDENEGILEKIITPLALISLSVAVKRLPVEVLPKGVFTNIVSNVVAGKQPASADDRESISKSLLADGQLELVKLQEHIRRLDAEAAGTTVEYDDLADRIDPDRKFVNMT